MTCEKTVYSSALHFGRKRKKDSLMDRDIDLTTKDTSLVQGERTKTLLDCQRGASVLSGGRST